MYLREVLVLLATCAVAVHGITFDEYEVVMRNPLPAHVNDSEDLFGYTAALHNLMDPSTAGTTFSQLADSARIIIGVPNGNPTGSQVTNPGYVVVCNLRPSASQCMPLRGSGLGDDRRLYDSLENDADEDKQNQFLGVAMESRDGRFAVCAHKWKFRGEDNGANRLVQGLCLQSGRDLQNFQVLRPCTYESGSALNTFNGWISLNQGTTGFGYCSSGTDISFMENGNLILGAPGTHLWKGSSFVYNGSDIVPNTQELSTQFGYSGMSVRQARVTSPSKLEWVSGSPRASNYFGQLFVYDYSASLAQTSGGQIFQEFSNPVFTLTGQQIGAYYGYSVAGVDFNGDQFDDVLVGAPLFFKGSSLPEVGAVYVYENTVTNNIGSLDNSQVTVLNAPGGGVAYSRFGHAIAPLGDLDDDGFDDVAISAPFGQGQSGTVYIYRGSRQGIVMTPAQTLVGSELNLMPSTLAGLTSFGAYLSGGTDIDGNQYNDLVIGAFLSRKVFVIRSRTVATITTSVTPSSTSVQIKAPKVCEFDGGSENDCFMVTYCMAIAGKGFSAGQTITVNYTLYADNRTSGLPPRATFNSTGGSVISGQTSLSVSTDPCNFRMDEIVYVGAGSNPTVDELLMAPLRPAMDVSVPQGDRPPRSDGNQEPVDLTETRIFSRLQGTQAVTVVGARQCRTANCSSDISVSNHSMQFISRSDPSFNDPFILVGVVSDILFSTTITNAGPDAAYNVILTFTHPTSLTFSRVEGEAQFTCTTNQNADVTTCSVVSVLGMGLQMPVQVRFVVLRGTLNGTEESIPVSINTLSAGNDEQPSNNMYTFGLPVRSVVSPSVTVSISNDQLPIVQSFDRDGLPRSLAELGREVKVNFTVRNGGPSDIGQGRLTIYLPYRSPCTTMNRFLFYITSVSDVSLQRGQCLTMPAGAVNPLRLNTNQNAGSELGNGTTVAPSDQQPLPDVQGDCTDNARIVCNENTPGCVTVVCTISSQPNQYSGQVSITGYLDDVYFKTLRTPVELSFVGKYELLDGSTENNVDDNMASETLELNPDITTTTAPFEYWPIIVAAGVAMIFIVIAIIALWACGFFKRRQKWKMEQEQGEEDQQATEATASTEEEVPNGNEKPKPDPDMAIN